MKILFVSPSYKPAYIYGGPAVSVSELAEALVSIGRSVTVYTTTANGKEELEVETGKPVLVNGVVVFYFKRQTGDHTHVSVGLWKKVWANVTGFDVVHLQSWWSFLILGVAAICRAKKKEFIVSPRGMLSSYTFAQQNSFPKKVLHNIAGAPLLKKSYLHATSTLEWRDCEAVIPSWKGFILPNLVRLPESFFSGVSARKRNEPILFGFLSRVDHKKGLELLFAALGKVDFDFRIRIAGAGDAGYVSSLKQLATELNIQHKIEWCGWMNSEQKFQFLSNVDVFVLTSYNENFANSVVESLSVGTPVLISDGVGLSDFVQERNLGWICKANVDSIYESLLAINIEQAKLASISKEAPLVIKKVFNKINLAYQYTEVYEQFAERKYVREINQERK